MVGMEVKKYPMSFAKEWNIFAQEFNRSMVEKKYKKPQIKLNNKHEHCDKVIWRSGETFKKFYQLQRYFQVNVYSRISGSDTTPLESTAHMIAYINREVITFDGLYAWLLDMNNKRCDRPFKEDVLMSIAKRAFNRKNIEPKPNSKYKYLFRKDLKLTHKEIMNIVAKDIVETNTRNFHELLDSWDYKQKYTREEAAKRIGVKPNTISSWKTRFPELYADADQKIKNIKQKHMENKTRTTFAEGYIDMLIEDEDVVLETEASWDNKESADYKAIVATNQFTRLHMDDVISGKLTKKPYKTKKKGFLEDEMDKLESRQDIEVDVVVYLEEDTGLRFVPLSTNTMWFENGQIRGIYTLDKYFVPQTIKITPVGADD